MVHQPRQRADRVLDVAEAPRLRAIAVDLDRLPRERPLHEAGDHHPVLPGLAGADGVEEADDHAVEPALVVVAEREELVHCLRVGVKPPARRRGTVDPAVGLDELLLLAVVAVDLGRRRDEHTLAEPRAVLQHGLRPLHVGDERVHRLLDDEADADRRREMEDDVALVHELVDDRRSEDRVDDEVVAGALPQVRDVAQVARGEVVERVDLPPVGEQQLGEVRADETGAPRDERLAPLCHAEEPIEGV